MHIDPQVLARLPHRPPMVLLERFLGADEDHARCELTVDRTVPFTNTDGALPAWIGIELMAQTIAVWAGHQSLSRNELPQIGWLLGTQVYRCTQPLFPAGMVLSVAVRRVARIDRMGSFDCKIEMDGQIVASAQVKVYLTERSEFKGNTHTP